MQDELSELLKAAIYKENTSEAFYIAAQQNTDNPSATRLMRELADEEHRHSQMLKELKERDWKDNEWRREEIPNLRISEYLIEIHKLERASLQDTVVSAMKREQHAVEFYSRLMSVLRSEDAKQLCERLAHEELNHKYRLEVFYDDFFYGED
jgi:rubrerythrin